MTSTVTVAFDALALKYGLSAEVRTWLTDPNGLNSSSIDDFVFAMATESEASLIVDGANVASGQKIQQTSRVRQAWAGARKARSDAELIKARGRDDTDLDALLTQQQLDDIQDVFYARYRMRYPASVMPSDAVVSRISKEVDKRAITMRDLWKVKTQSQLLRAVRRKTQLGDGVEVLHPTAEDEGREVQSISNYLTKLHSLLLAYAIVGSKALSAAPSPEKRGTDTCLCVEVPLDIVMKYYFRVKKFSEAVPYSQALAQTRKRDESERELWIEVYRGGDQSLGCVIRQIYNQREAIWQPPDVPVQTAKDRDFGTPRDGRKRRERADRDTPDKVPRLAIKDIDQTTPKKKFLLKMKNGSALCQAYQHGKCSGDEECPKGKHLCAVNLGGGRVCGGKHSGAECKNKRARG